MAYKEYGATIAPSNVSNTGFPIAMGTHIGGGRIVNNKDTLNSKHWCLLGEGATLNNQKANAIGQIWYDTLDSKYWKLDSWSGTDPVWVDVSTIFATRSYVDTAINDIPDPMIFKGSLGTGGTITSLPTASSSNTGFTYKVITAGTYAGQVAKIGDTFISDGTTWNLIPSGDDSGGGSVTSITLNATSPILIDNSAAITTSGTRTFSHDSSSGNKHIPSGGSANQILKWSADGTAVWGNDVNTHYTSKNIISSSAVGITNASATNPYLNHIEESTVTSSHRISGSGATTVSSDTTGNITISSTDTNTTYSFATGTTNGTFNVTPSGGSATPISIYGLGSAAYTASTSYASSSHTHSVFTTTENGFVPKSVTSNTTDFLRRDGSWASPSDTTYTLPLAASGTRGGIQIGYTESGANIPLLLSSEKGYVTLTSTSITTGLGYTPYNSTTNSSGYTTNTGTVTSVDTGIGLEGGEITTTGIIKLAEEYGDSINPYASKTAKYVLAAPNTTDGLPSFRALTESDIPILNQNTTGSAATLTTPRSLTIGNTARSFDGSTNLSWSISEIGIPNSYDSDHQYGPYEDFNDYWSESNNMWQCQNYMKNGPASSIGGLISNSTIGYKEAILYQIGAYEKMQILYILDSSLNTLGILEGSIFLRTLRTLNADKWRKVLDTDDEIFQPLLSQQSNVLVSTSNHTVDPIEGQVINIITNTTTMTYNINISYMDTNKLLETVIIVKKGSQDPNIKVNITANVDYKIVGGVMLNTISSSSSAWVITLWNGLFFIDELSY